MMEVIILDDDEDVCPSSSVPVPGNILWFEFLLDPNLLEKHFASIKPDPPPLELIGKFLGLDQRPEIIYGEPEKIERDFPPTSFKAIALKILTMKVLAYLKWDLDALETRYNSKIACQLITDLLTMATQEDVKMEPLPSVEYEATMDAGTTFAVCLYHRWVLKSLLHNSTVWKQSRVPVQTVQDPNGIAAKKREEFRIALEAQASHSVSTLRKMIDLVESIAVPTVDSFVQPTEATLEINTKWQKGLSVSPQEFKFQVHYELAQFLMFRGDHDGARSHLMQCMPWFQLNQLTSSGFCTIDKRILEGLLIACDVPLASEMPQTSLIERFSHSKWNHYQDMVQVLQMDNLLREIPVTERDMIEVELQQAIGSGSFTVAKDLLMKIQVLNVLRRVMARMPPSANLIPIIKSGGDKYLEFFLTSIQSVMFDAPKQEQDCLDHYLLDLMIRCSSASADCPIVASILADEALRARFSPSELSNLHSMNATNALPKLSLTGTLPMDLIEKCPRLEIINIQHKLDETYDCDEIRTLLQSLLNMEQASQSVLRTNNRWDVPIPLQSAVMSLPKGFAQELVFILLAKSRELKNRKLFSKATALLEAADKEAKNVQGQNPNSLYKLTRLISWEALVIDIDQFIHHYPKFSHDSCRLVACCKACLNAAAAGESVIPRLEVMESCAIALLNLGQWDVLAAGDRRLAYVDLAGALANACQEVTKFKGTKKLPREAWDIILPVFSNSAQKRNSSGANVAPTGVSFTRSCLIRFLLQLREPTVLAVTTSLLARLHNVLRDEPSLEINGIYSGLWPALISNSNAYNARTVSEVLSQVASEALKFMPDNFSMLKLKGDLCYAAMDSSEAMRHYLEATAVATDYFTQPITKPVLDDFVLKRMIKCCTLLNCYTQAAVLCQCLDDVDYATAFRCLTETKNLQCADAMDAYYPCIWDITLLEYLVNHHNKRGEILRKQQVIKHLGLLELNSNNNEEIQNEAVKVRKSRLFRALLQQYCVSSR